MTVKICTFNVKGLADIKKRTQIFNWFRESDYNIIMLQEIHCKSQDYKKWEQEWGSKAFFSGNSSNSKGICILCKNSIDINLENHNDIIEGRLQSLTLSVNNFEIFLLNIYGPNHDDASFIETIEKVIANNDEKSIIAGGDYNSILDVNIDKKNSNIDTHRKSSSKLKSLIENYDLVDVWRLHHPDSRQFTWHSSTKPIIFCRLDYFLVSSNLINHLVQCNITTGIRSDHSMVNIILDINKQNKGPGYFKLNNSVLLDEAYQQKIKTAIREIVDLNSDCNANTLWEIIKGTIRNETIKYCSMKKKEHLKSEIELIKEIDNLQKQVNIDDNNINLHSLLTQKKNSLEEITAIKAQGYYIRTKSQYIEGMERNTKYFSSLEKKKFDQKTISKLKFDNEIIKDSKKILQKTKLFYENIYKNNVTITDFNNFFDFDSKKCTPVQKQSCEGELTETECANALLKMNNNKSPGSDGLTVEFYKIFWNDIKQYLTNSINLSYQNGSLTQMQKQGIINLIPKKDKDTSSLHNWRPISLLNIDYKIATKAIANRLKPILCDIIDHSQTGFLKGRYIGENIRLINEIIDYLNKNNEPGLLFFADFEKAFDSINHDFIFKTLQFFNFFWN